MGHMKWITSMVADGTYVLFKSLTKEAILVKKETFLWDTSQVDTKYAKYVCEFVDGQEKENT